MSTQRFLCGTLVLLLWTTSLVYAQGTEQVNTTGIQTLSGPKTLTAPIITNPVVTGTVTGTPTLTEPILTNPTITGGINGSAAWESPGAIGGVTPSTIEGTTITATSCFVVITDKICSGTGSPESVITAPIGSTYARSDGGTGTSFYIKETGAGNTGWVAVSAGGAVVWTAPGTIGSTTPNTGAFTTLSVTGQFTSTVSTGTAPAIVSSTTKVANLNVDLLDSADWAAPLAIGTTTPAAITGTTITSTACIVVIAQKICSGAGSPEGVLTAPIGSLYQRNDGAPGTTLYSKQSGTGNAGWAALAPSTIDWQTPGAIGATTPNIGIFTYLTATTVIGSTIWPAYSTTVAIDATYGMSIIEATDAVAFTIQNPTNAIAGMRRSISVANLSGGVLGTITWDALYKMATFTKPANNMRRTVDFYYDGNRWFETACSPEVAAF